MVDVAIVFLAIVIAWGVWIHWLCRAKNAWDVMMFNTTLAMVMLFMIGILDSAIWDRIVVVLGAVAIGTGIAGILKAGKN